MMSRVPLCNRASVWCGGVCVERCGESVRQERRMREWMGRSVDLQAVARILHAVGGTWWVARALYEWKAVEGV